MPSGDHTGGDGVPSDWTSMVGSSYVAASIVFTPACGLPGSSASSAGSQICSAVGSNPTM